MEYKSTRRMFTINYREAGRNSYYTAVHTDAEGNVVKVYTRKSLSSLKSHLRAIGADFVIKSY